VEPIFSNVVSTYQWLRCSVLLALQLAQQSAWRLGAVSWIERVPNAQATKCHKPPCDGIIAPGADFSLKLKTKEQKLSMS